MKLKKWVSDILIMISFLSVLIATGDCKSDILFMIKTIICIFIFATNSYVLIKYGRI